MNRNEKDMGKMRAAVCEDEKIYSDFLRRQIEEYFAGVGETVELSVFYEGEPLAAACEAGERYDIIFLDIQLKTSDGVEVARRIRECDREVALIFVTGLESRMAEGYEVAALDYVVKSSLEERLPQALERFSESRRAKLLAIPLTDGDTAVVKRTDILWIESEGRGTLVGMKEGEKHSVLPVGRLAGELPGERFVEVHKSVYVQIQQINRIGTDTVLMNGGKILPLSRRRRKPVMSAVMEAVKGR